MQLRIRVGYSSSLDNIRTGLLPVWKLCSPFSISGNKEKSNRYWVWYSAISLISCFGSFSYHKRSNHRRPTNYVRRLLLLFDPFRGNRSRRCRLLCSFILLACENRIEIRQNWYVGSIRVRRLNGFIVESWESQAYHISLDRNNTYKSK